MIYYLDIPIPISPVMRGRIPVLLRCSLLLIGGLLLLFPVSSSAEQRALRRVIESPFLQYPDMFAKISHRSPKIPVFVADAWRRSEISSVRFRDSWRRSEGIDVLVPDIASASRVYGAEHGQRFVSLVDLINQNLLLSVSFVFAAVIISVLGARSNLRRKCTTMICVLERVMVPIDEHFQHARLLLRFFLLALGIAILFWLTTVYAKAETAVLVNTEAFMVIDDADADANLTLRFGGVVNEQLLWERAAGTFRFTDDLVVSGSMSGVSLTISSLKNCNTIDTNANGDLACGTDDAGSGGSPDTAAFSDATDDTSVSWVTEANLWDGVQPGITTDAAAHCILVLLEAQVQTDDTADEQPAIHIEAATSPAAASCATGQVGSDFWGAFRTASGQEEGISGHALYCPGAAATYNFTVCSGTTGLDDGNVLNLEMTLMELGG